jgi:hypothetical protein
LRAIVAPVYHAVTRDFRSNLFAKGLSCAGLSRRFHAVFAQAFFEKACGKTFFE